MGMNENLFAARRKWPLIFGPSGNETHLKCWFICALKSDTPPEIQQLYNKLVNQPVQKQ